MCIKKMYLMSKTIDLYSFIENSKIIIYTSIKSQKENIKMVGRIPPRSFCVLDVLVENYSNSQSVQLQTTKKGFI